MEVWTFIHKENKYIIRFNEIYTDDDDFATEYYFVENKYSAIWFSQNYDDVAWLKECDFVHAQYSSSYTKPNKEHVNLDNYEIKKFILSEQTF